MTSQVQGQAAPAIPQHSEFQSLLPGAGSLRTNRGVMAIRAAMPAVWAWLAHVVVVLATAVATVYLAGPRAEPRHGASWVWTYLLSPLSTWDGGWYLWLAREGYARRRGSAAFWPLYPSTIDLGHVVSTLPHDAVAVLLSNAYLLAALVCLFYLVRADYGERVASRAVWLAALSPLAFFFSTVYTEALFLLLTVGALLLGRYGYWSWAAVVAALAALTRSSGVLVVLPLTLMLIQQRGVHPRGWWTRGVQLLAAAAAPGVFAFHLHRLWGDALLMVHIQERWLRVNAFPWQTLADSIHRQHRIYAWGRHYCDLRFSEEAFHTCRTVLDLKGRTLSDDLSFIVVWGSIAFLPFALWRLKVRDSAYLVTGLLLPLFSPATFDPLLSNSRFAIVLFPFYVVLAMVLRWRPVFVLVLVVSTLAMAGLLAMFAQRYFVA